LKTIDINCDVGEGLENEAEILPYISSCSIACTGHAGTIKSIDETIRLAKLNNVKIGAHPSFPDQDNFGRKFLKMPSKALQESLEFQINILKTRAGLQGKKLNHIKTHGALYNASAVDIVIAQTVINAIKNTVEDVFLYVPFNSKIEKLALLNNIPIKYEVFIDRNYNDDLTLVSRSQSNAIITKPKKAFDHVFTMIDEGKVKTILNRNISIKANTYCIHGDNKNVLYILKYISQELISKGFEIA